MRCGWNQAESAFYIAARDDGTRKKSALVRLFLICSWLFLTDLEVISTFMWSRQNVNYAVTWRAQSTGSHNGSPHFHIHHPGFQGIRAAFLDSEIIVIVLWLHLWRCVFVVGVRTCSKFDTAWSSSSVAFGCVADPRGIHSLNTSSLGYAIIYYRGR